MVTQKCHKVPEVYPKKVPREECREVPGVNCYLELELVETPKCYPVPVEECDDILKVGEKDESNKFYPWTFRKSHIWWTMRSVTWCLDWTATL